MESHLFHFELLSGHEPKAAVNLRTLPRPRDFARFEAAQEGAAVPHCGRLRRFSAAFRVEVHGRPTNRLDLELIECYGSYSIDYQPIRTRG